MNAEQLEHALRDVFDHALVHHAFTPYLRDYEAIVRVTADPRTGIPTTHLRYLFRYCVEVSARTTVAASTWRASLDDRLIDYATGVDLDGYVWGVEEQVLYPGMIVVSPSARARRWTQDLGIDFHEVGIEGNAHAVTVVFSDLEVSEVAAGYAPFVVGPDRS